MAEPPGYGPPPGHPGPYFDPADPLISADYAGWWRRSLAVIARTMPQLLVLMAIGALTSFLGDVVLGRLGDLFVEPHQALVVESDRERAFDAVSTVTLIAEALVDATVLALMTLAVVYVVVLSAAGREPTIGACLRGAARRLLPVLGWTFLGDLLIGVGLLICVLPGIYVYLVLIPLVPVVAVERRQGVGRCFDLFHATPRIGWSRNGTLLALTALGFALLMPLDAVVGPTEVDPGADTNFLGLALSSVVYAVVVVLTGPFIVTAYADLRARREPISTAGLAEQLGLP